jgi:hypothetical protein
MDPDLGDPKTLTETWFYQSSGYVIAAFSRRKKVLKKERKGTDLELPGGMSKRKVAFHPAVLGLLPKQAPRQTNQATLQVHYQIINNSILSK